VKELHHLELERLKELEQMMEDGVELNPAQQREMEKIQQVEIERMYELEAQVADGTLRASDAEELREIEDEELRRLTMKQAQGGTLTAEEEQEIQKIESSRLEEIEQKIREGQKLSEDEKQEFLLLVEDKFKQLVELHLCEIERGLTDAEKTEQLELKLERLHALEGMLLAEVELPDPLPKELNILRLWRLRVLEDKVEAKGSMEALNEAERQELLRIQRLEQRRLLDLEIRGDAGQSLTDTEARERYELRKEFIVRMQRRSAHSSVKIGPAMGRQEEELLIKVLVAFLACSKEDKIMAAKELHRLIVSDSNRCDSRLRGVLAKQPLENLFLMLRDQRPRLTIKRGDGQPSHLRWEYNLWEAVPERSQRVEAAHCLYAIATGASQSTRRGETSDEDTELLNSIMEMSNLTDQMVRKRRGQMISALWIQLCMLAGYTDPDERIPTYSKVRPEVLMPKLEPEPIWMPSTQLLRAQAKLESGPKSYSW